MRLYCSAMDSKHLASIARVDITEKITCLARTAFFALFFSLLFAIPSKASKAPLSQSSTDSNCASSLISIAAPTKSNIEKQSIKAQRTQVAISEKNRLPQDILVQPSGPTVVLKAELNRPTADHLKLLIGKKNQENTARLFYAISPDDQVFFSTDPIQFNPDETIFAKVASSNSEAGHVLFPVKEGGEVLFRSVKEKGQKQFELQKQYGVELSEEEVNLARASIHKHLSSEPSSSSRFKANFQHNFSRARVMKCQKILAEGKNARKFIVTKLGTDLSLLTAGIAITAPGRFDTVWTHVGLEEEDPQRDYDGDLLVADYTTTSMNTVFRAGVGYVAATEGVAFLQRRFGPTASSMMMRSSSTALSVGLQTIIYSMMTDNDAGSIGAYNLGYSVFSMVKSHYIDRFILSKLPEFAYNTCLRNPALSVLVGQKSVRLVEGMASTVLYLGARSVIVGEGGNTPKESE